MSITTDSSAELDLKAAHALWGVPMATLRRLIKGSYRKPGARRRNECKVTELRPGFHFRQDGPGRNAKFILHKQRCEEFLEQHGYWVRPTHKEDMLNRESEELIPAPDQKFMPKPDGESGWVERMSFSLNPSVNKLLNDQGEFNADDDGDWFDVKTLVQGNQYRFTIDFSKWSLRERVIYRAIGNNDIRIFTEVDHREDDGTVHTLAYPVKEQHSCFRAYLGRKHIQAVADQEVARLSGLKKPEPEPEPAPVQLDQLEAFGIEEEPRPTISGHQNRINRGARQLALECPNKKVRDRIGEFYRIYGEHTGLSQSAFLVNFMLETMTRFDVKNGGAWKKVSADEESQT